MATEAAELGAWDRLDGIPDPLENRHLVGRQDTLDRLARNFAGTRMHHAWLLTGPRGIGKATMAARFAGHVLRYGAAGDMPATYIAPPEDDSVERRIARAAHPNLLYLRRAWNDRDKRWRSELTVEEIRRCIPFFGSAAAEKGWRVAVVDTADDMNRQAANALLKILEEPPRNTLFLVLAHSGRGMPATIRSRCQALSVRPLEMTQVLEALDRLDLLEGVSEQDRTLVGQLAEGSVRRAIVILRADGLQLYRRFESLTQRTSKPDWAAIHQLAGDVAPAARNDQYRLLIEFAHDHIAGKLRGGSAVERSDISALAGWVEVWEKVRRSADRTDAYNLDRKQVILNLFSAFHGAA